MECHPRLRALLALLSLSLHFLHVHAIPSRRIFRRQYDHIDLEVDESMRDTYFHTYLSRPDLEAPKWDLKIHNERDLAPGYWFLGAYGNVEQDDNTDAWVAPYIYDGQGELVWSGAELFKRFGVFDFRVSKVDGQDVLSLIYPHGGQVVILDERYETLKSFPIGIHDEKIADSKMVNIHDFNILDDKFIVLNRKLITLNETIMSTFNYTGSCIVQINGFEVADLSNGRTLWTWTPEGKIRYSESDLPPVKCESLGWDFIHPNSVEVLPDGDYLVSARHVSTIYKVSSETGAIRWRLGGKHSNFVWTDDEHFLGQHDARYLSHNETHMRISIMDNAIAPGLPRNLYPYSRGMIIAINTHTQPMTVSAEMVWDHPKRRYALARGNMQVLPNGNAFLGWSDTALHSEHSPDGRLLMEAFLPLKAKTYRSFKFQWVGRPTQPPDVHSAAAVDGDRAVTTVHVSWNGATEVARWRMYKSNMRGDATEAVATADKKGFETALNYTGFARFVKVDALDAEGTVLGTSKVVRTLEAHDLPRADVLKESQWLQDHDSAPGQPAETQLTEDENKEPEEDGDTPPSEPEATQPEEVENPQIEEDDDTPPNEVENTTPSEVEHTQPFKPEEPPPNAGGDRPNVQDNVQPGGQETPPPPPPPPPPNGQGTPPSQNENNKWAPPKMASEESASVYASGAIFLTFVLLSVWLCRRIRRKGSLPWRHISQVYKPLLHSGDSDEEYHHNDKYEREVSAAHSHSIKEQ